MRKDLIVSQSIEVNAEPAKVWEALTNPEIIKEYLFGTKTITDWKVGSSIIFKGEYDGYKYEDKGVIIENVLNSLLSYTHWSSFSDLADKPENYSLVTYTLVSNDNKTTVFTWTHKGYASEESYKHSTDGMGEFLQQMKEIMEK